LGFDGRDVNLYSYVRNNPTKLSDPFGLYVLSDVENVPPLPPSPKLDALLTCMEKCYGSPVFIITSTHEDVPKHPPDKPHGRGEAADIKKTTITDPQRLFCCAAQCGAGYGHGGSHYHVQIGPGLGGPFSRGSVPGPPPCGCSLK